MPGIHEHVRAGRDEQLFQYPTDGIKLSDFSTVLETVNQIPFSTDARGAKILRMPDFLHNGEHEKIVITARHLNVGKPGKPKIFFLPPYPFPARMTKFLFAGNMFSDWDQEGISPFEANSSMPHPYRSAQGAMFAYAGGMRMLREGINSAHDKGQNAGVIGFSYGANLISAYLSHVDAMSPEARAHSLPDSVIAIEGGKIFESILRSTYGKKADPHTVAEVINNNLLLPTQTPLAPDIAQNTLAIINNEDVSVLGQSETWRGARQYEISGTHTRAPIRSMFQIRHLSEEHFQALHSK